MSDRTLFDPCGCIVKVDALLAERHLCLKKKETINVTTCEIGIDIYLETWSTKRGIKAVPMALKYCPFCGKMRIDK